MVTKFTVQMQKALLARSKPTDDMPTSSTSNPKILNFIGSLTPCLIFSYKFADQQPSPKLCTISIWRISVSGICVCVCVYISIAHCRPTSLPSHNASF